MEVIKKSFFVLLSLFFMAGCSFLDYNELTTTDPKYVFNDFDRVNGLVMNVYSKVSDGFDRYDGAMLACACDEAVYAWSNNRINNFFNGVWGPLTPMTSTWSNNYSGISAANYFLENKDRCNFESYKDNLDYEQYMQRFSYYEYEVRFLRAFFYFELVRTFGDVPLVKKTLSVEEANSLSRTPKREVFDYIISECNDIYDKLPYTYKSLPFSETGRVTRLAVLALKARTLMYKASPLFKESDLDEFQLWKDAAVATKQLIEECEANGVVLSKYSEMWGENGHLSNEIIFDKRVGEINSFEKTNFPIGVEGGNSGNCPTQTLVDASRILDTGKYWDEVGSGYNPSAPNQKREDRYSSVIAANGVTKWPFYNTSALEIFEGGKNASPILGATPTGYYLKKFCDGTIDLRQGKVTSKRHNWIIFRLGEFYLNYAECVAKYFNDPDKTDSEFPISATSMLNKLCRFRCGSRMPDIITNNDMEVFKRYYENERMVELSFEEHRFWDIRRWKEGEKMKRVTIAKYKKENNKLTMKRETIERNWEDKMYFFPIPDIEIRKNNNLKQNEGW